MKIRCRLKVQTGSVNGEVRYTWRSGLITAIINGSASGRYHVRVDDTLYFCSEDELWVNLKDLKDHV